MIVESVEQAIKVLESRQSTFDFVAHHLLTQKEKAAVDFICQYRTDQGLACAVGCLIPKSVYDETLEGDFGSMMNVLYNLSESLYDAIDGRQETLQGLQSVHDSNSPNSWHDVLSELAEDWNLNSAVLYQ